MTNYTRTYTLSYNTSLIILFQVSLIQITYVLRDFLLFARTLLVPLVASMSAARRRALVIICESSSSASTSFTPFSAAGPHIVSVDGERDLSLSTNVLEDD